MAIKKNPQRPPVFLVSACLVGLPTRYDGAARPCKDCRQALAGVFWVPVCPEQLGGLPTPRPPADLVGGDGSAVLAGRARVVSREGLEFTAQFLKGAELVLGLARDLGVAGAFLKSGSPSCGCGRVLGVTAALLQREGFTVREFQS
jgi:uncharacterized protein YbbK (DUF523 family)